MDEEKKREKQRVRVEKARRVRRGAAVWLRGAACRGRPPCVGAGWRPARRPRRSPGTHAAGGAAAEETAFFQTV